MQPKSYFRIYNSIISYISYKFNYIDIITDIKHYIFEIKFGLHFGQEKKA